MRLAILGAGNWGTTLGILLSKKIKVVLWTIEPIDEMLVTRENRKYLPGHKIPLGVEITNDLAYALSGAKYIIFSVPSTVLRELAKKVYNTGFDRDAVIISVIKGLEDNSFLRMSEILKEELRTQQVCVVSGPTIAREVVKGLPTACVCASTNIRLAEDVQKLMSGPTMRVYRSSDVVGVELGGALKNIIALACGICDGLELGANAKGALISRGLREITRLGKKLGADEKTFSGLSGLGDIITTSFSKHSRNRFVGEQIGRGRKLKDILSSMVEVAEGVHTTKVTYHMSQKYKVDMPITREVYKILYEDKLPAVAIKDLMMRELKHEHM